MKVIEQASTNGGKCIKTTFDDGSYCYHYASGAASHFAKPSARGLTRMLRQDSAKAAKMNALAAKPY